MAGKEIFIKNTNRASLQYQEGDAAFADFVDVDDCPYPSRFKDRANIIDGEKRLSWMCGWYDAKYKMMFPKLFDEDHSEFSKYAL